MPPLNRYLCRASTLNTVVPFIDDCLWAHVSRIYRTGSGYPATHSTNLLSLDSTYRCPDKSNGHKITRFAINGLTVRFKGPFSFFPSKLCPQRLPLSSFKSMNKTPVKHCFPDRDSDLQVERKLNIAIASLCSGGPLRRASISIRESCSTYKTNQSNKNNSWVKWTALLLLEHLQSTIKQQTKRRCRKSLILRNKWC